jgi:hypothetical protein
VTKNLREQLISLRGNILSLNFLSLTVVASLTLYNMLIALSQVIKTTKISCYNNDPAYTILSATPNLKIANHSFLVLVTFEILILICYFFLLASIDIFSRPFTL